jgi:AbiV family abortive infection protein
MEKELIQQYNQFRNFCLKNAESLLQSATQLKDQNVNHIVYHLCTLALEEIGKIFVRWMQLNQKDPTDEEKNREALGDHVKKLFWAIWGPGFIQEKISGQQLHEMQGMAGKIHLLRLFSLYTDISDTIPATAKISNEDTTQYINFTKARFDLAQMEGEIDESQKYKPSDEALALMDWTEDPSKRAFIFGNTAQDKLVEFGDVKAWIIWLKDHFEKEEKHLNELLQKELSRPIIPNYKEFEPKWKITFKVITPSHSIRPKALNAFPVPQQFVKLSKGPDNNTLVTTITLDKNVPASQVWHQGWVISRLLVASLNVATGGIFWWNVAVDTDKYYDKIYDEENHQEFSARLNQPHRIEWREKRLVLTEKHLAIAELVFEYFMTSLKEGPKSPVNDYILALGMLAKTDIHLPLEREVFRQFYILFKQALIDNEGYDPSTDFKEAAFTVLEKMITDRRQFNQVLDQGSKLLETNRLPHLPITLTEVITMKQYCEMYLLTLAARHRHGDKTLRITLLEERETNS